MPNIDNHPAGDFCWVELGTTDASAAKSFYSSLFGWQPFDVPMGPGEVYTIFHLQGRDAAAAYKLNPTRQPGVPPHWMLYIAATGADDSAARAAKAGATVLAPPFDVAAAGRMAVIQDPTGAVFSVWQAKDNQGIGLAGVDGTLCWADLMSPNVDRAKKFYEDVFGWQITPGPDDPSGYLHIKNGEQFIGGIPPSSFMPANVPPHWMLYFLTSDIKATVDKAKSLGAKIYVGPMRIEKVGDMAVIADPQGAVFSAFQPLPH
jgi:predicted enzyme related to lactoylglutathione lyase